MQKNKIATSALSIALGIFSISARASTATGLTLDSINPEIAEFLLETDIGSTTVLSMKVSEKNYSSIGVLPISLYQGSESFCDEFAQQIVCVDDENFYIDDALLQVDKEWKIKVPKSVRDIAGAALGGSVIAGPAGGIIGAIWKDRQITQNKIAELRSQNREVEARLLEAQINNENLRQQKENEIKNIMNANSCLRTNIDLLNLGNNGLQNYLNTFTDCLDKSGSDDAANACLNSYYEQANSLLAILVTTAKSKC